jgi:Glycosyl transferase family 2
VKVAAIAIVRNAVDLAPLTALHHHLIGADRVWVIDNGSSDGTYEVLRDLARKVPGLRVDRDDGPFDQAGMATRMANELLKEDRYLIVPFDADECWDLSIPRLARFMARERVNAVVGDVVNYIQARSVSMPTETSWRLANRRVGRPVNPGILLTAMQDERHSYVELILMSKMMAAPPRGATVDIVKGAHSIRYEGRTETRWRRIRAREARAGLQGSACAVSGEAGVRLAPQLLVRNAGERQDRARMGGQFVCRGRNAARVRPNDADYRR